MEFGPFCSATAVGFSFLLTVYSAFMHSPTIDDGPHLSAGLSHWYLGRFDLYAVNPPFVRAVATIPVLGLKPKLDWAHYENRTAARAEFAVFRDFVRANGISTIQIIALARVMSFLLMLPGLWILYCWLANWQYSPMAVIGVSLWCLSPSMLAFQSLITPDAAATSLGVVVLYRFRRWMEIRNTWNALLVGMAASVAILCKTTWLVILPPAFALVFIIWRVACISWPVASDLRSLLVGLLLGMCVVNVAYGFERTGLKVSDFTFHSQMMIKVSGQSISDDTSFLRSSLRGLRVPLPGAFIEGVDLQRYDFDRGYRSYLMGEWKHGGWWYYYLVGFLVKEPIGFQLMLYASILHGLWNCKRWSRDSIREWSLIVTPPLLIFGLVSSQTGFNHHMRYVLPAYPFLFIIAARTVTLGKSWKWFSYGCLTWQAAAVLWFAPHWMSYFNEVAGGPKNGHKWLVNSNIDWGQDILMLKWWQDKHPEAAPLNAAMFTGFDPKDIGLKFKLPAPFVKGQPEVVTKDGLRGPQPGWYAVSVCMLKGLYFSVPEGDGEWSSSTENFTYFLNNFTPVEMIGYSIYIYHITEEEAARVRAKLLAEEAEFLKAEGANAGAGVAK